MDADSKRESLRSCQPPPRRHRPVRLGHKGQVEAGGVERLEVGHGQLAALVVVGGTGGEAGRKLGGEGPGGPDVKGLTSARVLPLSFADGKGEQGAAIAAAVLPAVAGLGDDGARFYGDLVLNSL